MPAVVSPVRQGSPERSRGAHDAVQPHRIVPCPACGELCELAPLPCPGNRFHLLDLGVSEESAFVQASVGNHRCPQLDARTGLLTRGYHQQGGPGRAWGNPDRLGPGGRRIA